MNAKDFRIGNYYFPTDGSGFYKEVTAHELVAWASGAVFGKPIPLTPEWIERFGFENHKLILPYHGAFQSYLIAEIGAARVQICKNGYFAYDPEIRYVHQLQNLYFALTGEELYGNASSSHS